MASGLCLATTNGAARPGMRGQPPEWDYPAGVNIGGALHDRGVGAGFLLGAEASVVRVSFDAYMPELWRGAYVDGLYDSGLKRGRFSLGPEIGYAIFGIDGGFVAEVGGGRLRPGFAVRPLVTAGFVSLYCRFAFIPSDPVADRSTEIGALLKWPFGLK